MYFIMSQLGTKKNYQICKADNDLNVLQEFHTQLLQNHDPDTLDIVKLIPVQVTVDFDIQQQKMVVQVTTAND